MQWLGSLLFTIFLFLWTGGYAVFFSAVGAFLPFRQRAMMARGWGAALLVMLRILCRWTIVSRDASGCRRAITLRY